MECQPRTITKKKLLGHKMFLGFKIQIKSGLLLALVNPGKRCKQKFTTTTESFTWFTTIIRQHLYIARCHQLKTHNQSDYHNTTVNTDGFFNETSKRWCHQLIQVYLFLCSISFNVLRLSNRNRAIHLVRWLNMERLHWICTLVLAQHHHTKHNIELIQSISMVERHRDSVL